MPKRTKKNKKLFSFYLSEFYIYFVVVVFFRFNFITFIEMFESFTYFIISLKTKQKKKNFSVQLIKFWNFFANENIFWQAVKFSIAIIPLNPVINRSNIQKYFSWTFVETWRYFVNANSLICVLSMLIVSIIVPVWLATNINHPVFHLQWWQSTNSTDDGLGQRRRTDTFR